jgi:isopentenyl diphosphate isomerase/L-lactate dehydrogenase-like FMN-dependent dehydrogenase
MEDAKLANKTGATAIVVSNNRGRAAGRRRFVDLDAPKLGAGLIA